MFVESMGPENAMKDSLDIHWQRIFANDLFNTCDGGVT